MRMDQTTSVALDVSPAQIIRSSGGRGWHGLDAAEILHAEDDFAVPAIPRHVLVFNLGMPMVAAERRSGRSGSLDDGGVMILSAYRPRDWHLDHREEVRHLHLYLDPGLVRGVAAEAELDPDRVELVDAFGISDPRLAYAGMALLAELRAPAPEGRIYAESLATVLAVQLLRCHSLVGPAAMRGPSCLAPAALKRATDYIEEHLSEDLSLAAVADAAHLSPYHFARLFKASTGLSPHRYIIRRRVERARSLLVTTDLMPSFIAREVGFSSASHLAMHFKRLTGLTPGSYR